MINFDDLKEGFYILSKKDGSEACLVKLYKCEDFIIRHIGFGVWDGAGLMPITDLSDDSIMTPVIISVTSGAPTNNILL